MAEKHGRLRDLVLSAKGIGLHHHMLKHSEHWPIDDLCDYQVENVRLVLIHAFENTPYYRKLFMENSFNPYKDFQNISDLSLLPILQQKQARLEKDRLADGTQLPSAIELRTSGTTGEPFICYASPRHWVMEQGVTWRHWKWIGYNFRDPMAIVRSYVPQKGDPLWKIDKLRNFHYLSAYHISEASIELYVSKLRKWEVKFLRGYPSSLYLLAKHMAAKGLTIDPPKAILTASETLLPHYRTMIENTFGAPVFDWYGLGEPAITMMECEAHEGMHVNMEYGVCELHPDPGLPDNQRRIVATSLHNTAMPLIRYETRDIAVVGSGSECSCGRTLPLIERILGRSDDFLYGSGGRALPSVNFYTLFYDYPELLRFQMEQEFMNEIIVRISCPGGWDMNRRAQFLEAFRTRVGEDVAIILLENEQFSQSGEGKTPVIIQRIKGPAA